MGLRNWAHARASADAAGVQLIPAEAQLALLAKPNCPIQLPNAKRYCDVCFTRRVGRGGIIVCPECDSVPEVDGALDDLREKDRAAKGHTAQQRASCKPGQCITCDRSRALVTLAKASRENVVLFTTKAPKTTPNDEGDDGLCPA